MTATEAGPVSPAGPWGDVRIVLPHGSKTRRVAKRGATEAERRTGEIPEGTTEALSPCGCGAVGSDQKDIPSPAAWDVSPETGVMALAICMDAMQNPPRQI